MKSSSGPAITPIRSRSNIARPGSYPPEPASGRWSRRAPSTRSDAPRADPRQHGLHHAGRERGERRHAGDPPPATISPGLASLARGRGGGAAAAGRERGSQGRNGDVDGRRLLHGTGVNHTDEWRYIIDQLEREAVAAPAGKLPRSRWIPRCWRTRPTSSWPAWPRHSSGLLEIASYSAPRLHRRHAPGDGKG